MTIAMRLWVAYVRGGAIKEGLLRRFLPSRMSFVHYSWPLRPTKCPCDVDFCEYLRERDIGGQSVFHLGTGGHHLVGMENARLPHPNDILALTLAPREHAVYVKRVIRDPSLGKHYKVLFADLLSLSAGCLPLFDVVTLFHLCELDGASTSGQRLDAAGVLALLRTHVRPGGIMLFYPGSYGYPRLRPLLVQEVAAGHLSLAEEYKSLAVYRTAG